MRLRQDTELAAMRRWMLSRSPPRNRKSERSERQIVAAFAFFVFGMFALDVLRDYQPLKLSVLFMVLVWAPMVAIHEAGHALAAALLGWRVCRVVVGMGPPILRFGVYGVPVELRLFPAGGYVLPAPTNLERARLKSALVYFAGPAAELVVLGAVIVIVRPEVLLARSSDPWLIFAQSVALVTVLGALFNLLPLSSKDGSWTDGLGVVMSAFLPRAHFERGIAIYHRSRVERRLELGDLDAAVTAAEQALASYPENLPIKVLLAQTLIEAGRPSLARERLEVWLERPDVSELFRVELLCTLAEAERELGDDELDSADEHSRQALELAADYPRALLTRASVLLERARFHESKRLIEAARGAGRDAAWLDECESWLVLLDFRRGNRDDARVLLEGLVLRGARGRLLDRVIAEVRGVQAVTTATAAAEKPGG